AVRAIPAEDLFPVGLAERSLAEHDALAGIVDLDEEAREPVRAENAARDRGGGRERPRRERDAGHVLDVKASDVQATHRDTLAVEPAAARAPDAGVAEELQARGLCVRQGDATCVRPRGGDAR